MTQPPAETPRRVVQLPLDKKELMALIALASLGTIATQADLCDAETHRVSQEIFQSANDALRALGVQGWADLLERTSKLAATAFPEITRRTGAVPGRRRE